MAPTRDFKNTSIQIAGARALDHFDVVRGVAALSVVVGHVRGLFFANWVSLPTHDPILMVLYFVTGLGRQAVMVFFVLSGFFIGYSVIGSIRSGRWSWRGYIVRRLTRLGIVLLPALFLTAFWDLAGIALFGVHSAYLGGRSGDAVLTFRVVDHLTPPVFFGNLFFLQGIHQIPPFGSNAPLWSLSYEFWYYLLLPIMVSAFMFHGRTRLAFAAVAGLILIFIGPTISVYYLVWLLGVAIVIGALMLANGPRLLPAWTIAPAVLLLGLGLAVSQRGLIVAADGFLGVSCAIFLTTILLQRGSAEWNSRLGHIYATAGRRLAACSYTLYLVHLPILLFLRAALNGDGPWLPDWTHSALGLAMVLAVLGYALAVANFTEARTDQLRGWIVRRFPALA